MSRHFSGREERVAPEAKEDEGDRITKGWVKDPLGLVVKAVGSH